MVVVLFLSFMFPAYLSFKALKADNREALIQWGKYWVMLSLMVLIYHLFDWLLNEIPLFGLLKCICAYILVRGNGVYAALLYDRLIVSLFTQYEDFIDSKFAALQAAAGQDKQDHHEASHNPADGVGQAYPKH